jgi:hypothetical protein
LGANEPFSVFSLKIAWATRATVGYPKWIRFVAFQIHRGISKSIGKTQQSVSKSIGKTQHCVRNYEKLETSPKTCGCDVFFPEWDNFFRTPPAFFLGGKNHHFLNIFPYTNLDSSLVIDFPHVLVGKSH